jgi:uroporphyrinogen decarboxylase
MDLGSARFTGIVQGAYDNLRSYLGFGDPGPVIDQMQQLVAMDERILQTLGVDVRAFAQAPPDRGGPVDLGVGRYRDEWGVTRVKPPGSHYYDLEHCPLAGDIDAGALARFPWPDPLDPGIVRGLREQAQRLRKTGYAVMYNARFNLVHTMQYLRGFEDWFLDLGQNHDLFQALMQAVLEVLVELNHRTLAEVGDLVDIVAFGDDIGQQDRAVASLATYRKLIRPAQERIVETIRAHTRAKILYHTCGSVYTYIDDFIGIGIDALNPVQVTAKNMEPRRLKREFGDRITFWGGIDTQRVLPRTSPAEVAAEVHRMFECLGAGGGWVLAAVHNIQPDVPPQNICAMFNAGRDCTYE